VCGCVWGGWGIGTIPKGSVFPSSLELRSLGSVSVWVSVGVLQWGCVAVRRDQVWSTRHSSRTTVSPTASYATLRNGAQGLTSSRAF